MRGLSLSTAVSAALVLLSPIVNAEPHASMARRHMHSHQRRHELVKRGKCAFPTDAGLVSVTPGAQNAGWAMSPDQPCTPGSYCPYACPAGQLMAQWDPKATKYAYPESMRGGLYCNENGEIEKPFPNKPYCYDGVGTVSCTNKAGAPVAICQTVLPGNEAMLIPTLVTSQATLAVPDTGYWCKTAAHYYINPPGVSAEDGCIWGNKNKPHGNWAPYVTGANQMDSGETFVTVGWNPIYIEPDVPFRNVVPDYGVRIECSGGKCGGLPCYIDPAEHGVNEVSQMKGPGAGGANFCVVSVPKGAKANVVVFSKNGGGSSDNNKPSSSSSASPTTSSSKTFSSSTSSTASSTPTSTSTSSSSSSSTSSTSSSSSEPSRTTDSSSSIVTDSPSSTEAENEPTPTETSASEDEGDDNNDGGEEDQEEDSTPTEYDGAELYVVDETSSESIPKPTSDSKQANAAATQNDGVIDASPDTSTPEPSANSGVSLSISRASAMFLCSVFTALVVIL